MSGQAAKILLTTQMHDILQQIVASRNALTAVALRANMILLGFQKLLNTEIAERLEVGAKTVGLWWRRWRDSYDALLRIQFEESAATPDVPDVWNVLNDAGVDMINTDELPGLQQFLLQTDTDSHSIPKK